MKSPVTGNNTVKRLFEINIKKLINQYKKFNIDVTPYFKGVKKVELFECSETGYKFYHPSTICGDSFFYEHFQKFSWYYMPWKWEHELTANTYIKDGDAVLEVGCAHGNFLVEINKKFKLSRIDGLELNKTTETRNKKIKIRNKTIQDYCKSNVEKFDVVCSFQVLEHIYDVRSFISSKVLSLKKGGKLIICVPNNNSFIKSLNNCLNKPPHHIGLWTEESLKSLEKHFKLKHIDTHFESLQTYHINDYLDAEYYYKYSFLKKFIRKLNILTGKHQKLYKKIDFEKQDIIGHSILVCFEKL